MHPAYPPRKSSNPPPFKPRTSKVIISPLRRGRVTAVGLIGIGVVLFLLLLLRPLFLGRPDSTGEPAGSPPVVIVTVLDSGASSKGYIQSIRENRLKYAEKHGYQTFFAKPADYDLGGAPVSWTKIVALRHALSRFPDCGYVWYLGSDAYIMNPALSVEHHVMRPARLEALMIRDYPIVPPDSIIKTFSHLKGGDVDLVISQDKAGLSSGSMVIRNSEWAKFFLDTWFDPLYRSYNFAKAETHALEHIVQWHPTILSKLALVPQRTINGYSRSALGEQYQDGDLVVRFPDCADDTGVGDDTCKSVADTFREKWRAAFAAA